MKRNLLAISLCALLALSLGACDDLIPSIDLDIDDTTIGDSDTDEDLEDELEGDTSIDEDETGEDLDDEPGGDTPTHTEHTYGDYIYDPSKPEEGHYQVCLECGEKSISEEHSYEYTSSDSSEHTRVCSICGYEITEAHTLVLVDDENGETHHEGCEFCDYVVSSESHEYEITKDSNGVTHSGKCECGAEYLPEGHTLIYEPVEGENTHKVTCAICDYEEYESHYMHEAEHSEGTHTSICICGVEYETKENATYYSVTDENVHSELCTMCDYSEEGDHTNKGETDGNCDVCGYTAGLIYSLGTSGQYYYVYAQGTYTGTELVFPNSYEGKIVRGTSGGGAFGLPNDAASSITYVRIPKSMVKIGSYDFINAPYIEKVEFEEGSQLETIGYDAFSYTNKEYRDIASSNFTELNFPSTLTSIDDNAFAGRTYLETVTFGEDSKLESIGESCFYDCHALKSLTIPASVTSIGDFAFYECNSLESLVFEDGIELECISDCCFYDCHSLTEFTLPSGITSIGDYAFRECLALKSLTIPASVTSIGNYAFYECNSLESLTFEEGSQLTTIGVYAFRGCTKLESITIPASVKTIGECAFRNGDANNSALKSITFEEGIELESIEYCAFYYCYSLESIAIPESVKTIGDYAFYKCYSLKSITFEEDSKLESIGGQAFGYCRSLESLTIPSSVSEIGQFAFYGGTSLTSLTFEENSTLDTIGYAAFDSSALTEVTVPASVTTLGDWAFGDSDTLEEVTIEGSIDGTSKLTTLGAAFADDTALKTVTLPGSITEITGDPWEDGDGETVYDCLFTGCTSLETINFYGTEEQWAALEETGLLGIESSWNVTVNCLGSGD